MKNLDEVFLNDFNALNEKKLPVTDEEALELLRHDPAIPPAGDDGVFSSEHPFSKFSNLDQGLGAKQNYSHIIDIFALKKITGETARFFLEHSREKLGLSSEEGDVLREVSDSHNLRLLETGFIYHDIGKGESKIVGNLYNSFNVLPTSKVGEVLGMLEDTRGKFSSGDLKHLRN